MVVWREEKKKVCVCGGGWQRQSSHVCRPAFRRELSVVLMRPRSPPHPHPPPPQPVTLLLLSSSAGD